MKFPHPDEHVLPANIQCAQPPSAGAHTTEQTKVVGCLLGLALGDALGASVEFRPHDFLVQNPVRTMQGGGTWGLQAGQWTDDTSMALCLAASLITQHGFNPYDQLVRYKWWFQKGYLSSTGECFDIGATTRAALTEFVRRQNLLKRQFSNASDEQIDNLPWEQVQRVPDFSVDCGLKEQAGNGPLMRLAPVPLFYYRHPERAVELAGESARLTHGDPRAADACRYYAALIVAAIRGEEKKVLLAENFIEQHQQWFASKPLHQDVVRVAKGSFKRQRGYDDGICGKNFIINTLEAALWAFWADENSFEIGALKAVNLGDDTDTTAAVYGQLAGAFYGAKALPLHWTRQLYAFNFLICVAEWLHVEGARSGGHASGQQQQQQRRASNEQNFQRLPVPKPSDRVGYGAPRQQNPIQPAASSNNPPGGRSAPRGRLEPSSLPAAGVPHGFQRR